MRSEEVKGVYEIWISREKLYIHALDEMTITTDTGCNLDVSLG